MTLNSDKVISACTESNVTPDYDFMYLFMEAERAFVEAVARQYQHPNPERLFAKLRYFAAVDNIDTIVNGGWLALPGQQELARQRLRQLLSADTLTV